MSKLNDYILVTESRNLDDGSSDSDAPVHQEEDSASLRAFESSGISILNEKERTTSTEPRDQLSQELMSEGGIEIVSGEDEDESYL